MTPLIIERTLDAPVSKVWRAITNKNEMKKWYFDIKEFKPEVGFEFQIWAGDDKKKSLHLCQVTEVVPGKRITYSWRYDGYEGNSFVTFELQDERGKTKLTLTHAGLETFASVPDFDATGYAKGWTYMIGTALPEHLGKMDEVSKIFPFF